MVVANLETFSGKKFNRYFKKFGQSARLDGWLQEQRVKLLKYKFVGDAYKFLKSFSGFGLLSYGDYKARFIQRFTLIHLPGRNQLTSVDV